MPEFIVGAVSLAIGVAVGLLLVRLRMGAVAQRKEEILEQAHQEAKNIRKEQELFAKEELLKRREEVENELNRQREEQRDLERRLDKREASLEEQHEDNLKKEIGRSVV